MSEIAAETALEAVKALHRRFDGFATGGPVCSEDGQAWPCNTARAIGVTR